MSDAQVIALLITTILSLVGTIVFLYLRGEKVHKRYADLCNENLLKMTDAMVHSARSNEHLANSIDSFPERIIDKMTANGFKKKG